jgi:hypothetical protein
MGAERRPADPLANVLGAADGAEIPGGCEHCDACQTVRAVSPGLWEVDVFHDNWCPVLAELEGK